MLQIYKDRGLYSSPRIMEHCRLQLS